MAPALSSYLLERLQELARQRGVDVQRLLDEAVLQFVESASITDLTPDDVARTQEAMLGEIEIGDWDGDGPSNATGRGS